ncbi:MAG: antitoxin family protein [Anaerolineae bacterium]|nr:antitoxin family protein [Anaerolineae bacterium]
MAVGIRAVYQNGQLHLLDTVDLHEGQEVRITIQRTPNEATLLATLNDLVQWPDPTDNRHAEIEGQRETLAQTFGVGRPVSEMIVEDRGASSEGGS